MATNRVATHVEVTGESSYKQALSNCRKELSLLKAEQKLIEAQYKNTGDEQQYNANKAELLQRKLEAQRKVVAAAEDAIRELNEKGVKPSNASYIQWQKNLADAAADATTTQTELNDLLKTQHDAAEADEKRATAAGKATTALTALKDITKEIGDIGGDMNFASLNTALNHLQKVVDPDKTSGFLNGLTDAASGLTAVTQTAKGVSGFIGGILDHPASSIASVLAVAAYYAADLVLHMDELERERKFSWVEDLKALDAGISEAGVAAIKDGIKRGVKEGIDEADVPETLGSEIAKSYAGQSYQLVTSGYGSVENVGAAASYTKLYADEQRKSAKERRDEAVEAESEAIIMANLAGNTEEANAAQERLNQAEAKYQETLKEIESTQADMMAQVSRGSVSSNLLGDDVDIDALNDQLEKMALYAKAIKELETSGDLPTYFTYNADEDVTGLSDYAQKLADMWDLKLEDFQGVGIFNIYDRLIEELGNASKEAVNEGGVNLLADLFDTWTSEGMLEDIDFSAASGTLLAAYRASLLKEAAGSDQTFTRDELLEVLFGDSFQQAGSQASGQAEDVGSQAAQGMADGVTDGLSDVGDAGQQMGDALTDAAKAALDEHSPSKVFEDIGGNAAAGLAQGIYARSGEAIAAASWLASQVTRTLQSALQIHSPSKVFEHLGEYTGLGFAEGIEGSASAVDRAVDRMLDATRRPVAVGVGAYAADGRSVQARRLASGLSSPDTVHVTLTMDEEIVGEIMAPIINEKIGAQISARRR